MFTLANFLTWIAVGLIGGTLAGRAVTRQRAGLGFFTNLFLGCVGATVGGALFWLANILPNLDKISISVRDVVAAFTGSIIVLAIRWVWIRLKGAPTTAKTP
jgi:uncharacterized membrane protein YeaQ/YmgE (transglycosylase-associated protein family)